MSGSSPSSSPADAAVLARLFAAIEARRGADPKSSYTARLFGAGAAKIAQKVGEEAVETVIASLNGQKRDITSESADLLYHLLVLWAYHGIDPAEVWAELARREGVSGVAEKDTRQKD